VGGSRTHANEVFEVTGGRDRVAASRMGQYLVLRDQGGRRVLKGHQTTCQARFRFLPNKEGRQTVVQRCVEQSGYSSLRYVREGRETQTRYVKSHGDWLS